MQVKPYAKQPILIRTKSLAEIYHAVALAKTTDEVHEYDEVGEVLGK